MNETLETITNDVNIIEVVKETTGVKVLDVNVKVKNIYEKGQKVENKTIEEPKNEETQEFASEVNETNENVVVEEVVENKEDKKEE